MTAITLSFTACCCLAATVRPLGAQQRSDSVFRTELTATVVAAASDRGCRQVTLRWAARAGATGYQVHVAQARNGDWAPLPKSSRCGATHAIGATALADLEPATPATRRLFYRVIAVGSSGPIDSTDVVPVDLVASPATGTPRP